jgi:hypothetical protein
MFRGLGSDEANSASALRASVGSTEASDGRLARIGVIDRGQLPDVWFASHLSALRKKEA